MRTSRSLAVLALGMACLFLIGCNSTGTPRQAGRASSKAGTAESKASSPANSQRSKRTASLSRDKGSVSSPQFKLFQRKAVKKVGNPARATVRKPIGTLRVLLYSTLALILIVVIGALTAERFGRHRKLAPSPVSARR
jgi:hypothetical protein